MQFVRSDELVPSHRACHTIQIDHSWCPLAAELSGPISGTDSRSLVIGGF